MMNMNYEKQNVGSETKGMLGRIVDVHKDDGFGFVRGADGRDYFFRLEKFASLEAPTEGRWVRFEADSSPRQVGKAPKIRSLSYYEGDTDSALDEILKDVPLKNSVIDDSRVVCKHCGRKMVPRVGFYHGMPSNSYCPFCLSDCTPEGHVSLRTIEIAVVFLVIAAFILFAVI